MSFILFRGTTTDQSMQSIDVAGKKVNIIDSAGIRNPQNYDVSWRLSVSGYDRSFIALCLEIL